MDELVIVNRPQIPIKRRDLAAMAPFSDALGHATGEVEPVLKVGLDAKPRLARFIDIHRVRLMS
ncbi:hypothetical protein [Ancylobacter sp.]|uniref:hypothetical protein n=1 Tax=Ancylobacter sp. TaxID=1872567 RepID=UPI003C7A3207